jgi:hypothetical protein
MQHGAKNEVDKMKIGDYPPLLCTSVCVVYGNDTGTNNNNNDGDKSMNGDA